ncbi:MAG: hypothetical protein HY675_29075 [Chloroflexi bacterium]|nr:hypothetical protein [Chloroflexota bacterium]
MTMRVTTKQELIKRAREEIESKTGKATEELYQEREKRIKDAIQLREPDRVPVLLRMDDFVIKYAGYSPSVSFYEPAIHRQAVIRTLVDFDADFCWPPANTGNSGLALEALDARQVRWPGGNLPADATYQFIGAEYMKEDEYDLFITDPTDFMLRYYLPRVFGALAPLSKMPAMGEKLTTAFLPMTHLLGKQEFQTMAQALLRAGEEQEKFSLEWTGLEEDMAELGFPLVYYPGGVSLEPFDLFASFLRGLRGIAIDMFRRPEKLLAACDRVVDWRLARALPAPPNKRGHQHRIQSGALHFSSDRFMSKKQFETFSWPSWKRALLASISLGYVPCPFGEGKTDDRLEYFLELPKATVFLHLTLADMARAKALLGNHCCIGGSVPSSLLVTGSASEVEDYCKNLIKVCGKGGGFILSFGDGGLHDAKPENVKAAIDSAKKYGRY